MKTLVLLISVGLILLTAASCYYDSEEYLYPQLGNECDTTNITFTHSVTPILQNSCYGCHSNATSAMGGGIKLQDYADVKVKADDGSLIGTITHAGGYSPMPMGADQLPECKITIIQKWVDAGAPDNKK
jgi:hypothetical protein